MKRDDLLSALQDLKVFNDHGILLLVPKSSGRQIGMTYHAPNLGARSSKTTLWIPGEDLNPKAPWYDYGAMAFHGKLAFSRPLALEWAQRERGIAPGEWVRSPFGGMSWVPKRALDAAIAAVAA